MFHKLFAAGLFCLALCTGIASAQCEEVWSDRFEQFDALNLTDAVVFDDGSGPALFVSWADLDGSQVGKWDGRTLTRLSAGLNGEVYCLEVFDADGPGPEPAKLIAGGAFTHSGTQSLNRLAAWDGTAWTPFGSGLYNQSTGTGLVRAMCIHHDDEGPALVVVGNFDRAGGVVTKNVAMWRAGVWSGFGPGPSTVISTVASWDFDGPGPQPARVVIPMVRQNQQGVSFSAVYAWGDNQWNQIGEIAYRNGPNSIGGISHVLVADTGDGPALYVAGRFSRFGALEAPTVARWNGEIWQSVTPGLYTSSGAEAVIALFDVIDPDGDGPEPARIIIGSGGSMFTSSGVPVSHLAWFLNGIWQTTGADLIGTPQMVVTWEDPSTCGEPTALFAGTGMTWSINGIEGQTNLIKRVGGVWKSLNRGLSNAMVASTVFDPDGDAGPERARLIVGGGFSTVNSEPVSKVAAWDGTAFSALGNGLGFGDGSVLDLETWDPDGPGPLLPRIVAAGNFNLGTGSQISRVAQWDGVQWTALGTQNANSVPLLALHDFGEGEQLASLQNGVMHVWNGIAWSARGGLFPQNAKDLISYSNGSGSHLYALHSGRVADGVPAPTVVRWNGEVWEPLWRLPGKRFSPGMAFDTERQRAVLFGGEYGVHVSQTWEAAGDEWHFLTKTGPSARRLTSMVYNTLKKRVMLFGGHAGGTTAFGDLWMWDGEDWEMLDDPLIPCQVIPPCRPPARHSAAMMFDSARNRVVLFGGVGQGNTELRDTWEWDGDRWHLMHSGQTGAPPAGASTGAYLPTSGQSVIFAAAVQQDPSQVWAWDGAAWTNLGTFPVGARSKSLVYDEGNGTLTAVTFGTGQGTTRVHDWNGNSWQLRCSQENLQQPAGAVFSTVYDSSRGRLLSFFLEWSELIDNEWTIPPWSPIEDALTGVTGDLGDGHRLYVGFRYANIWSWDGTAWDSLPPIPIGVSILINDLAVYDPDGPGGVPGELYASVSRVGSPSIERVLVFRGGVWEQIAETSAVVQHLTFFDDDGHGPLLPALYVGGGETINGISSSGIGRYGCPQSPLFTIVEQPESAQADVNGSAEFTIIVDSQNPVLYQWRRQGEPLSDGTAVDGTVVAGAMSPTLQLSNIQAGTAGFIDCEITVECVTALSESAILSVASPCRDCIADFNMDDAIDDLDIGVFFEAFASGDPCADADGSGGIDDLDITAFFAAFEAGC